VLVRPDGAGIAHARATTASMLEWEGAAPQRWFVAVGPSPFDDDDIDHAMRVPRLGSVPLEPVAAALACGFPGRPRALARSGLVHAARRIVASLAQGDAPSAHGSPPSMSHLPTPRPKGRSRPVRPDGSEAAEYPKPAAENLGGAVGLTTDVPSMVGE
jgi:hypothetical protein